jgi:flagellar hook-associated protein 3 FlgL
MAVRISTNGQSQLLLQDVLRNQQNLFARQNQVTSGMKSPTYQGISRDVGTLSGAKSIQARTEQFLAANVEVDRRMNIYDATLEGLRGVAQELRDNVLSAINTDSGIAIRSQMENLFDTAVNMLNTRDNGRYVFSGTRTDTAPVTKTTPATLAAVAASVSTTPANVFANNSLKQSSQIDDNLEMNYGILGEDVGKDLMESMRRLFRFSDGTENFGFTPAGSFTNPMGANQANFLKGELLNLNATIDAIDQIHAKNGVNQQSLAEVQKRHTADLNFMTIFISDIEEVDIGEAISRLNQDQVALDSSYRVLSQITRSTLLDFI